jgi:hypothetical protein
MQDQWSRPPPLVPTPRTATRYRHVCALAAEGDLHRKGQRSETGNSKCEHEGRALEGGGSCSLVRIAHPLAAPNSITPPSPPAGRVRLGDPPVDKVVANLAHVSGGRHCPERQRRRGCREGDDLYDSPHGQPSCRMAFHSGTALMRAASLREYRLDEPSSEHVDRAVVRSRPRPQATITPLHLQVALPCRLLRHQLRPPTKGAIASDSHEVEEWVPFLNADRAMLAIEQQHSVTGVLDRQNGAHPRAVVDGSRPPNPVVMAGYRPPVLHAPTDFEKSRGIR